MNTNGNCYLGDNPLETTKYLRFFIVRDGGQMWNKDDKLEECKCIIPDRSYATAYRTIIEDCQENGQFDWTTTGMTNLESCHE